MNEKDVKRARVKALVIIGSAVIGAALVAAAIAHKKKQGCTSCSLSLTPTDSIELV